MQIRDEWVPDAEAWRCDLCGREFKGRWLETHEPWTGNNFIWCPTCVTQQTAVVARMGCETFRAAWAAQCRLEGPDDE